MRQTVIPLGHSSVNGPRRRRQLRTAPGWGPTVRGLELVLVWAHGLSAAAWFGAIFYRTTIVDPKAFRHFTDRVEYERFSIRLAHGMRYVVSAGLLICGFSGFALMGLKWNSSNETWLGLVIAKVLVWLAACGLFGYVSWVHWPWRSLAASEEFPAYRRQATILAGAMTALSGVGFLLGQACRLLR